MSLFLMRKMPSMTAIWAMLIAPCACAQTPAATATDIARVRHYVRSYVEELPQITCTERTRQTYWIAGASSIETSEDSCDTKHYKLFAMQSMAFLGGQAYEQRGRRGGRNRTPVTSEWRERLSNASLGTSTGFLAAIVSPQADASFRWVRMRKVNGRAVSIYGFRAEMTEGFVLAGAAGTLRVPFKGLLYADAVTGALVRAEIQCIDIPRNSEYTEAELSVDFSSFDVAGRTMNLPSHSVVRFRMTRGAAVNEADYGAYRLASFRTDTEIQFGDQAEDRQ